MRLDGELKRQKEAAELGEMKTTETEVKRRKVIWEIETKYWDRFVIFLGKIHELCTHLVRSW